MIASLEQFISIYKYTVSSPEPAEDSGNVIPTINTISSLKALSGKCLSHITGVQAKSSNSLFHQSNHEKHSKYPIYIYIYIKQRNRNKNRDLQMQRARFVMDFFFIQSKSPCLQMFFLKMIVSIISNDTST